MEMIAEINLAIKSSLKFLCMSMEIDFTIPADLTFGPTFYKKDCRELKGKLVSSGS